MNGSAWRCEARVDTSVCLMGTPLPGAEATAGARTGLARGILGLVLGQAEMGSGYLSGAGPELGALFVLCHPSLGTGLCAHSFCL